MIRTTSTKFKSDFEAFEQHIDAYISRCHAYRSLRQFESAQKDCTAGFAAFETGARAWGNRADRQLIPLLAARGALASTMGRLQEALKDEDEAVYSLTYAESWVAYLFVNRGLTHLKLERYDDALEDFDQAVRLDKKYLPAYVSRGWEYKRRGLLAKAKADFEKALSLPAEDYDFGADRRAHAEKGLAEIKAK